MAATEEAKSKTNEESHGEAKGDTEVSATVDTPTPNVESAAETLRPMPGLELLGRGIYLKPRQPYELKQRLVKFAKPERAEGWRAVYCVDAGQSYLVPDQFEVNHSPPMPVGQTLNQTVIEQSWESLASHFEVNADVAAGVAAFSVKANSSQIDQLRCSEEAYYALRTSFIPAWTVDLTEQPEVTELRVSLEKVSHTLERQKFLEIFGEELIWMYDLLTLLSERTREPAKSDLAKLRDAISKLVPDEVDETIPNPLTAEDLDALRKSFNLDEEQKTKRVGFSSFEHAEIYMKNTSNSTGPILSKGSGSVGRLRWRSRSRSRA